MSSNHLCCACDETMPAVNGDNGFPTRSEAQDAAVEWERLTFSMTRWLSPVAPTTPLPITV